MVGWKEWGWAGGLVCVPRPNREIDKSCGGLANNIPKWLGTATTAAVKDERPACAVGDMSKYRSFRSRILTDSCRAGTRERPASYCTAEVCSSLDVAGLD